VKSQSRALGGWAWRLGPKMPSRATVNIAVKKDLSNLDYAIERLDDESFRRQMIDRAYEHVLDGHTYAHRVRTPLETVGAR
jgi:spore maturation protein CgeB